MVDKTYCMNSYLIYRYLGREDVWFYENVKPSLFKTDFTRKPVRCMADLDSIIRETINMTLEKGNLGLMLSGGIDSAILARYLPAGTKAYTLKCIADGAEDETVRAKRYAEQNRLDHTIIEVTWDDYQTYLPKLLEKKGAPIHSIEPQIYKAARKAKEDGITYLLFGENADIIYGGMDGLLSKDWTYEEFMERYMYVDPRSVLKEGEWITEPFKEFIQKDGSMDFVGFINKHFYREACGTYTNACSLADIQYVSPYTRTYLNVPLDLQRIRKGDTKYIVRELYNHLYPDIPAAVKLPMPRPISTWLNDWKGPQRCEFIEGSADNLSGNQRWMIYCLERFLNLMEGK